MLKIKNEWVTPRKEEKIITAILPLICSLLLFHMILVSLIGVRGGAGGALAE